MLIAYVPGYNINIKRPRSYPFRSFRYHTWHHKKLKIMKLFYILYIHVRLTLMDANSSVVSDESLSICSETAAPLESLMFIRWYGDSGMARAPTKCKITQKPQAIQNGT